MTDTNPRPDEVRAAALLVAEARAAVHESLTVLAAPEADRVRALIADLETAIEGRTAICLSAATVPAPAPTDETALRARIAGALHAQMPGCTHDGHGSDCGALADAVLAVLPATASRTAILYEVAELAEVRAAGESSLSSSDYDAEAAAARALGHLANHLRTMAAAVPQPGGGAGCSALPCNEAADELCDNHARIKYHGDGEHTFCEPDCTKEASS